MPSFTKLFSGISNAVKQEPSQQGFHPHTDPYHKPNLNKTNPFAGLQISIQIESPPLMLYGLPENRSSAIFSGLLVLDVFPNENSAASGGVALVPSNSIRSVNSLNTVGTVSKADYVEVRDVQLSFIQIIDYGRPFEASSSTMDSCADCRRKTTELAKWDVLSRPSNFAKGSSHAFPFSHLVPGTVPATAVLSNVTCSIRYELICKTTFVNTKGKLDEINLGLPVMIRRSLTRGQDRNSLRVFPPTDVTATAVIPNVAYPKSVFPVEIRMDNVCSAERRWRMRKLNWKLEESVKVRVNHCDAHKSKYASIVEHTKRSHKGRKVYKNCGGPGKPVYNYTFENPRRREVTEENEVPTETADQTASNDVTPSASHDLAPVASSWSVASGAENIVPQISNQIAPQMTPSLSASMSNDPHPTPAETETPMYVEEIRVIKSGELKSGWKSDFSNKGRIEIVADISLMELISMGLNASLSNLSAINSQNCESPIFKLEPESGVNCACDIEDYEAGIFVHHNLVLEVIVAEEMMHNTNAQPNRATASPTPSSAYLSAITSMNTSPVQTGTSSQNSTNSSATHHSTASKHNDGGTGPDHVSGNRSDPYNHRTGIPTGVARVLRMQFRLVLMERPGLGMSWDDEVPPTYNAVGALSPPAYNNMEPSLSQQSLVIPLDSTDQLNEIVLPEPASLR
ncbi:hypothetical protein OGAPHI_001599 [Ogataea philodendri]|uniref:LDB19 N-terminal domain-containing protein n=1 Tax=Ogataea philodendri TaxID=1378263 RepID=A0A9P8PC14_9ASCO|nr:uncharacterized protein OGAPHI_001599 [Ogataea philodendri]KAH3669478.1 hypothetical protein OGAPHI_001599 [Ogataea philodendri]